MITVVLIATPSTTDGSCSRVTPDEPETTSKPMLESKATTVWLLMTSPVVSVWNVEDRSGSITVSELRLDPLRALLITDDIIELQIRCSTAPSSAVDAIGGAF